MKNSIVADLVIWVITTLIFAFGILTFDYWLDHSLSITYNIVCWIIVTLIVAMPVYSFWEAKVKRLFNISENEQ
jgi:hypothetical protein